MVDTKRPAHQLVEAVRFEVGREAFRRYKDTGSRVMKTTQKSINPRLWYEGAGRNIFRKFGVITCCKTQIFFQAVAPSGNTKRSFGGNVNMINRQSFNSAPDICGGSRSEANFWIGRHTERAKSVGRQELHARAEIQSGCR